MCGVIKWVAMLRVAMLRVAMLQIVTVVASYRMAELDILKYTLDLIGLNLLVAVPHSPHPILRPSPKCFVPSLKSPS
jgi:hypothetical protein